MFYVKHGRQKPKSIHFIYIQSQNTTGESSWNISQYTVSFTMHERAIINTMHCVRTSSFPPNERARGYARLTPRPRVEVVSFVQSRARVEIRRPVCSAAAIPADRHIEQNTGQWQGQGAVSSSLRGEDIALRMVAILFPNAYLLIIINYWLQVSDTKWRNNIMFIAIDSNDSTVYGFDCVNVFTGEIK